MRWRTIVDDFRTAVVYLENISGLNLMILKEELVRKDFTDTYSKHASIGLRLTHLNDSGPVSVDKDHFGNVLQIYYEEQFEVFKDGERIFNSLDGLGTRSQLYKTVDFLKNYDCGEIK